MLDDDRFLKLKRDGENAPSHICKIEIVVNHDGTMGMTGPFGDRDLFLKILDQAIQAVRANAKTAGWLITPPGYGDALPKLEGYG